MLATVLVYLLINFDDSFGNHLAKCRLILKDFEEFQRPCTEIPHHLRRPCKISVSDKIDYLKWKQIYYLYLAAESSEKQICAPLSNNQEAAECVPASSEADQYNIDWTWSAWTTAIDGKRRRKIIRQHNTEHTECPYEEIESLSDCETIKPAGGASGVYTISADLGTSMRVYCEMDIAGGGWTVIQQRVEGTTDFFLYWDDYVTGFGDRNSCFWLGLENIELLTKDRNKELMIYMRHPVTRKGTNDYASATYNMFYIDDASDNYRLHVSGFTDGGAGESLYYTNGQQFSTRDDDNDSYGGHCATIYSGAWWYSHCHGAHLNGLWGSSDYASGIIWYSYTGHRTSLTFVKMMIKSAD